MRAHTPGPWEADGVIVNADDSTVATCADSYAPFTDEHVANARLIAAAPALLAALEKIVALNGCTGGKEMLIREYKHIASTAIAKARGA